MTNKAIQETEILNDAAEVELTVAQVRDGTADDIYDKLSTALDEAQAPVFSSEQPFNYVIIKIVP